jgi:hypothetical protein
MNRTEQTRKGGQTVQVFPAIESTQPPSVAIAEPFAQHLASPQNRPVHPPLSVAVSPSEGASVSTFATVPTNTPNTSNVPAHTLATTPARPAIKPLVDIHGLRSCGIFPPGREPSIRSLREWTRHRLIPAHRLGRLVFYDVEAVERHIRTKLLVPPRC